MAELEEWMVFKPSKQYKPECEQKIAPAKAFSPKGGRLRKGFMPLPCDIVVEKDVKVKMRDGVSPYVDIFRSATDEKVPVLISWSSYGRTTAHVPAARASSRWSVSLTAKYLVSRSSRTVIPPIGAHTGTQSATRTLAASRSPKAQSTL